jgi:AAA+ superfamily predicted ATPase
MGNETDASDLNGLLPLLQRLDHRLEAAIAAAQLAFGTDTPTDPYRGMHVTDADVGTLLAREPGAPAFLGYGDLPSEFPPDLVSPGSRLEQLQQTFGLSNFDLDVVAIALAPELDRRYERLYVYLQDDVRGKRPTVDLALNLLCADATTKLTCRVHFAADAPLIRQGLLHLLGDANPAKPTLLAHELHLDEAVTRFLLAQPGLDTRLTPFCQLLQPTRSPTHRLWDEDNVRSLIALATQAHRPPLRLYVEGPDRSGKRHAVEAIARHLQTSVLIVDITRLVSAKDTLDNTLKQIFRESLLHQSVLYLDGLDALRTSDLALSYQSLLVELAAAPNVTILSGTQPWIPGSDHPLGVISIPFPMPDVQHSKTSWQHHLSTVNASLTDTELSELVSRFRLTDSQIAEAVAIAHNTAQWKQLQAVHPSSPAAPQLSDFFAAARAQCGHELQDLARKVELKYTWNDIVLPPLQRSQLQEICNQARLQNYVYDTWGFGGKLSLGKGLNVLFTGLPGTGKTMAAEVLAHELQLDLYKIDLSQIVSKYIGETEKNLNRIFTAAANSNAILLFDEADALFGKRSDVKDAHDRYANIEVGYLLQKMEEYEGIAILTTNLRSNIDEAFVRRLRFILDFPLPDRTHRHTIWKQIFPATAPCDPELDLKFLADQFEITGSVIRNIALAAAFLAATDDKTITMTHITKALRREYQKTGRILMETQLGDYSTLK